MAKRKKKRKKYAGVIPILIIILCLLIIIGSLMAQKMIKEGAWPVSGQASEEAPPPAAALALDRSELTLYVTTSAALQVTPEGADVIWSSDNGSVATVDENGTVRALSAGTATIRAEANGAGASCTVTVLPLPEVTVDNPSGVHIDEGQLQILRDLTAQRPLNVSVYYRDLASGLVIEYNASRKYAAGSVVKAPYCKWLTASGADLNEQLTFTSKDILEGGGSVKDSPDGTVFTVQELIDKTIRESDNTAYNMLQKRFGFDGYLAYAKSLGVAANQSAGNLFGSMSAVGAGILFSDIYAWSQGNPELSRPLMEDLCSTSYRKLISSVTDVPVAHKYGYNSGTAGFHDAAIVYSGRPYVLTIFTNLNPDNGDTVPYIQSVASCLNSINAAH